MTDRDTWGPMGEPIHPPVPEGRPPWKDSAFLSFWDVEREVYGCAHVATSPNAPSSSTRFEINVRGRRLRVMETPSSGTFTSESINFDLDGDITVDSPRVSGSFSGTPLFGLADYSTGGLVPAMVEGEPLQHFQQPARVHGRFVLDGEQVLVDGVGWRDRTWGYRDESANWTEYVAFLAIFDDRAVTAMKFRYPDGRLAADGFVLGAIGTEPELITGIEVTRDAEGLAAAGRFTTEAGTSWQIRSEDRIGGFWVPMGHERVGPTMSSYDEFTLVSSPWGKGTGTHQHGVVRQLY